MEQENQQLKIANQKQTEQIMLLQDKLQGECCTKLQHWKINGKVKSETEKLNVLMSFRGF